MKSKKIKGLLSIAMVLCMMAAMFGVSAYADASISCTVNQDIGSVAAYRGSSNITGCSYTGALPNGMQLSYVNAEIYLTGTPTTAGVYTVTLNIDTEAGSTSSNVTITVSATAATQAPVTTKPVVTKNPTGETVEKGGSASFVARADGADSFVWRLVSKDTTNTIQAKDASSYFSGLTVSGTDSERLTLSNIPETLNGWSVECKFINSYGYTCTTGAIITVSGVTTTSNNPSGSATTTTTTTSSTLNAPKINTQPQAKTLDAGQSYTLTTYASKSNSTDTGTLTYQWYSSDTNSMSNIQAIDGANEASYVVPETTGTKYYCVGVWLSKDGQMSQITYSSLVSVTYNEAATNTTDPASTSTPNSTGTNLPGYNGENSTSGTTASSTPAPTPTSPNGGGENYNSSNGSSTLIFYIVVAVLALAAVGGILVYLAIVNSRGKGGEE